MVTFPVTLATLSAQSRDSALWFIAPDCIDTPLCKKKGDSAIIAMIISSPDSNNRKVVTFGRPNLPLQPHSDLPVG